MRAAANGEAVIVNGGIHLETSSVNCAAQYPAPGCSDHQAVTKHACTHAHAHTYKHAEPSDHWCSEEQRNHTSAERKTSKRGGEKERLKRGEEKLYKEIGGEEGGGGKRNGEIDVSYHLIWATEPRRQIR